MTDTQPSTLGEQPAAPPVSSPIGEIFRVALRLGLTSFGGPTAHLGYFREEYVVRRRWLDERSYADLVALCQFLPGPASSQVGIGIGTLRGGLLGGLAAWLGFTLPSAILLVAFAFGVARFAIADSGWLHGLEIAAVAVVAQAVWGMARQFCTDRRRATIAVVAATVALLVPHALGQLGVIAGAGAIGWRVLATEGTPPVPPSRARVDRRFAVACLALFFALLAGLPLLRLIAPGGGMALLDSFYRAGALVFGGGHVVLPLLQTATVAPGWLTDAQFVAGYGATQAVPGPLFTFAAYLGAARSPGPNGVLGAALAIGAIFLPSFLLIWGALPFWEGLRAHPGFGRALRGINAAVVGLLLAALYTPVWISAIVAPRDFALALAAFGLLTIGKLPPWLVVALAALGGAASAALG
jgi:chromate transporter